MHKHHIGGENGCKIVLGIATGVIIGGMILLAMFGLSVILRGTAHAHDIYEGLHGKDHRLCCGGDPITGDCAPTLARAHADYVEYLVRPSSIRIAYKGMPDVSVKIPNAFVTFLPVPGEETKDLPDAPEGTVWATFCGRPADYRADNVFDGWLIYCSFYPPGAI